MTGGIARTDCLLPQPSMKAFTPPMNTPRTDEDAAWSSKKVAFQPYHATTVPKPERLGFRANVGTARSLTTMMMRNIPNKYTQGSLLQEIDEFGFAGRYDFFYLPMDVHNRSNVGYAFINFTAQQDAECFSCVFAQYRFQRFQSRKIGSVCVAHVQGLDENLRHFENRAVTHAKNGQYRPIVFQGNCRVDFEEAVAGAKLRAAPPADASGDSGRTAPERHAVRPPPMGSLKAAVSQHALPGSSTAAADTSPCASATDNISQLLSLRSLLAHRLYETVDPGGAMQAPFTKPSVMQPQISHNAPTAPAVHHTMPTAPPGILAPPPGPWERTPGRATNKASQDPAYVTCHSRSSLFSCDYGKIAVQVAAESQDAGEFQTPRTNKLFPCSALEHVPDSP